MRISYLLVAASVTLSGCAVEQRASPAFNYPPDPVCFSERQCEAMWSRAPISIANATGMKVRMQADTYIETFDGSQRGGLLGRVVRTPNVDGSYTVKASISCQSGGCGDLYLRGQALFNAEMHAAGSSFGPTTNTTTDPGNDALEGKKEILKPVLR